MEKKKKKKKRFLFWRTGSKCSRISLSGCEIFTGFDQRNRRRFEGRVRRNKNHRRKLYQEIFGLRNGLHGRRHRSDRTEQNVTVGRQISAQSEHGWSRCHHHRSECRK